MKIATLTIFFLLTVPCLAYVAGSSQTAEGAFEFTAKLELMRGLAGPENLPETQQTLRPNVNIYEVGVGYGLGTVSVFKDIKVRLTGAHFNSAEEIIGSNIFYAQNKAWVIGTEISANFVHEVDALFGAFIRVQNPIDMNTAKFVNPKVDRVGLGLQSGLKLSDSFAQETLVFIGSGISKNGLRQNASLTATLAAVYILPNSFLNGGAVRLGPFFDGDLGERSDSSYGTVVRSFRLGFVAGVGANVLPDLGVDFTYVQKISGTFFRATKDYLFSIRYTL